MKDIMTFAAFMADTLVHIGALPAPRNEQDAQELLNLVLVKFEQFSQAYEAWCQSNPQEQSNPQGLN